MQYGILSDIHGNFAALQAVWRAFESAGVADHMILNAGDNVGYGSAPNECLQFLRTHANILSVQGNYDKNVALFPQREDEYRNKWGKKRPEKFRAIQRDSRLISHEAREWLQALPKERNILLEGGVPVLLTHYAPGVKEGLGHWTPEERFLELAKQTAAQVVICGHTHAAFVYQAGDVLFVNPGAAGRNWTGHASYAILTIEPNRRPTAALHEVYLP